MTDDYLIISNISVAPKLEISDSPIFIPYPHKEAQEEFKRNITVLES